MSTPLTHNNAASSSQTRGSLRKVSAFVLVVLATVAFAGCIGADGQVESKSFNLAYDGAQAGNHESSGACDSEGTLVGKGNITDGNVRLMLRDGSGNVAFDKTYSGDFTLETQHKTGASGTWKLTGERNGDDVLGDSFQGAYSMTVRC